MDMMKKYDKDFELKSYQEFNDKLAENLNKKAWDGEYYLRAYFDNGDKGNYTESQIRLWYGRMKGQGVKIDLAEEGIKKLNKRKQESYRRSKEQEINDHLKAYRQEKA
jgi:hypothetical protein